MKFGRDSVAVFTSFKMEEVEASMRTLRNGFMDGLMAPFHLASCHRQLEGDKVSSTFPAGALTLMIMARTAADLWAKLILKHCDDVL